MIAASTAEPPVGASTCASGSQVWTGHIGTFTANATKNAKNSSTRGVPTQRQLLPGQDVELCVRRAVGRRSATSISSEPSNVYRKNLNAA